MQKIKIFFVFALFVSITLSNGRQFVAASADIMNSEPLSIERGILTTNSKLQNKIDEYFKLRGDMFTKDKQKNESLKHDLKNFKTSNKVLKDSQTRLSHIAEVQVQKKYILCIC